MKNKSIEKIKIKIKIIFVNYQKTNLDLVPTSCCNLHKEAIIIVTSCRLDLYTLYLYDQSSYNSPSKRENVMRKTSPTLITLCLYYILCSDGLFSQDFKLSNGRMILNWSNHKLQFYGKYKPSDSEKPLPLAKLEELAIKEGINYAHKKTAELHYNSLIGLNTPKKEAQKSAFLASDLVSRTTFAYKTEVFKDGTIRVLLENNLARSFARHDIALPKDTLPNTPTFSCLILKISHKIAPSGNYEIKDFNDNILFSIKDMDSESYKMNLMGRWFYDGDRNINRWAGKSALYLNVEVSTQNSLIIKRAKWNEISSTAKPLLTMGRVALVVPAE